MNDMTRKLLIGAAIAGVMGIGTTEVMAHGKDAKKGEVKCVGGNGCKGHGSCQTAKNDCAGKNGCKGQGWVMAKSEDACKKLKEKNKPAAATAPEGAASPGSQAPQAN